MGLSALGLGKQSRLFRAIRSQLRAAYGFGAGMEPLTRQHRLLKMSGEVDTARLGEALATLRDAYEAFRLDGISDEEFAVARDLYRHRILLGTKRPAGVATMLMDRKLNGWLSMGLIQGWSGSTGLTQQQSIR